MLLSKYRNKMNKRYLLVLHFIKYFPTVLLSLLLMSLDIHWIIILLSCFLWWLFSTIFFDHRDIVLFSPTIRIWFGVPGSGKTSVASYLSMCSNKLGYRVLSNVRIDNTFMFNREDLGRFDTSFDDEGAHIIYDEASIDFDNRNFKKFAGSDASQYFALHRHQINRVDVFSQGYDVDKRIRDRAGENGLFLLRKFPIKGFVLYRKINKVITIDKETHQMIDGYSFKGLPRILCVAPSWKYFDTLDKSLCPKLQKEWQLWNE